MKRRPLFTILIIAVMVTGIDLALLAWASDTTITRAALAGAREGGETPAVALVLGTSPTLGDGRPNAFYWQRLRHAAQLWHNGTVQGLLVSGDNGQAHYDEPSAMMRDLIGLGVSEAAITRDFAGFSTFDSVVRARAVFGLQRVVVVSQGFHGERAVFLARATGLQAVASDAGSIGGRAGARVRLREVAARLRAMGDVALWGRAPRFLGPEEPVHLRSAVR